MCYYASWRNFANMVSLANLTITMRTASQLCAGGRSQNLNILDLDPRSLDSCKHSSAISVSIKQSMILLCMCNNSWMYASMLWATF